MGNKKGGLVQAILAAGTLVLFSTFTVTSYDVYNTSIKKFDQGHSAEDFYTAVDSHKPFHERLVLNSFKPAVWFADKMYEDK